MVQAGERRRPPRGFGNRPPRPDNRRDVSIRTAIIVLSAAAAVLLGVLVILHAPWVTGPHFWRWPYRRLPAWPLYGLMAVAAVPVFVAQLVYRSSARGALPAALGLVTLGCFALKLASVLPHTDPPSLDLVQVIVEDRNTTSYYTDAAALGSAHAVRQWLPLFPQYMPALSLHSKTKAPGPILYWSGVQRLLGVGRRAALVGGLALGLLGAVSVIATYVLLRGLTRDRDAAFAGATFMSLCPGFVLFFPMFDPAYPILSCAIVGAWVGAVDRRDGRLALLTGALLALACVVAFNVLVIGTFLAAYALVMPAAEPLRARAIRALKLGVVAISAWLALLALMIPTTGYDAFATFVSAWRNQHELLRRHAETRPYPQTIPFDLSDFAFGAAWSGAVLALGYFADRAARGDTRLARLSMLCVAQLVFVAVTGLLQMETARVWIFMLPLLMVPVGLELRAWTPRWRMLAYAATWFATAAVAQNVKLLY